MSDIVFNQTPLYKFLKCCESQDNKTGKHILDCGAGGANPPLSLFYSFGYHTEGIDLDPKQVDKANAFGTEQKQGLNIKIGDMTNIEFDDSTFDYVYSYNSIFHMKKVDILKAVNEMKRVLKPGGLLFVNFLSFDDFRFGEGPHLGDHQYEQMDDEPVIHSYYDYNEADAYFKEMEFVSKERRIIERIYEGNRIKQGFIDYIYRK